VAVEPVAVDKPVQEEHMQAAVLAVHIPVVVGDMLVVVEHNSVEQAQQ
jgi:hypothetical protein